MRTLDKIFQNEYLHIKVFRCLNRIWKLKGTMISKSMDLSNMNLDTIFEKL